jgi:hypothetical protein
MTPTDSRSAYRIERILDMLIEQDLDQLQITQRLCMSDPRNVGRYLDYLKSEQEIHICDWRPPKSNGHRWAVYRIGKGRNKRKPKPKTQTEVMRDYWRKKGRPSCQQPRYVASPFEVLFGLQEARA